jgi:hypothetical protein
MHVLAYSSYQTESFRLWGTDTAMKSYAALGYNFQTTWTTQQDGIKGYGLALRDYSINIANYPLSFNASITEINANGFLIRYIPTTFTKILTVSFCIFVKK